MISRWRWARSVILTRSARSGEAPAVAVALAAAAADLRRQGAGRGACGRAAASARLGARAGSGPQEKVRGAAATQAAARRAAGHFSVTEIETLRRDPYAIYARRILELMPLDPLMRDPGAAERGTLFHEILHRFSASGIDPSDAAAPGVLLAKGSECFAEIALPADVEAVWWPRFEQLAADIVDWERSAPKRAAARGRKRAPKTRRSAHRASRFPAMPTASTSAGRHGRHSRLQDRFVAVEGPGAHAACAAACAGRRASAARRVQGFGGPSPPTSPSSG